MRLGAAIPNAFWHRVRFVPDDVLSKVPTIGLQGKGHLPWDANEVFWLEAIWNDTSVLMLKVPFVVLRSQVSCWAFSASSVAVSEIEPERSVIAQYSLHFTEN